MSRTRVGGIAAAVVLVGLGGVIVGTALVEDDDKESPETVSHQGDGAADVPATRDGVAKAWRNLAPGGAEEVEHFDTLGELSDTTDVVVTGVVTAAAPGRVVVEGDPSEDGVIYQFLELTVDVEDNLADAGRAQYAVEFGPYVQDDLAEAAWPADLVGDEGIFVLRRKGSANPDTGAPQVAAEFELNKYRLVSSQGLLLNDGGEVAAPLAEEAGFPNNLEGADYETTVARVDDLAD
jgi:hypothetical protein